MIIHLKVAKLTMAASLLAVVAACGDAASNNEQDTNMQGNESAQAMPSGPFSDAEMQMHGRMVAAIGANASETWVRKMIEHHRGAVAMSQILIDGGGEPDFVEMARMTVEKQQREIGELERLLSAGITGGSGEPNPYAPLEQNMHQQMMAATGANISETWARKMIAHHQGAVDMSEVLIRQGGNPQVVAIARRTAEDQRREIAHLEAMLRGEPMPDASATPASPPVAKSAPANAAKEGERGAPARAARESNTAPKAAPTPRPAPTPAQSPTPKADCAPEHRAAGHC